MLEFQTFVWKNSLYIVTEYFTIFRIADSSKLAVENKNLNIINFLEPEFIRQLKQEHFGSYLKMLNLTPFQEFNPSGDFFVSGQKIIYCGLWFKHYCKIS